VISDWKGGRATRSSNRANLSGNAGGALSKKMFQFLRLHYRRYYTPCIIDFSKQVHLTFPSTCPVVHHAFVHFYNKTNNPSSLAAAPSDQPNKNTNQLHILSF